MGKFFGRINARLEWLAGILLLIWTDCSPVFKGVFDPVVAKLSSLRAYVFHDVLRAWCCLLLAYEVLLGIASVGLCLYLLDTWRGWVAGLVVSVFFYGLFRRMFSYMRPFL